MKLRYSVLLILVCVFNLSYAGLKTSGQADTLSAIKLKPTGRYLLDAQKKLELISTAAHFGFSFKGNECTVYASVPDVKDHSYLQYELDGVYQKKVRISGDSPAPLVIKTSGLGKHTVWIYKTTEAHTGPLLISKIAAVKVKALPLPAKPIIEFIGNSITCGAAADTSDFPCRVGVYHDHHNGYMAYGPRVARALNADYVVCSVSGIGMYRNWNTDGPAMPQLYENTDLHFESVPKWDFKTFTPKIVSIALGTNDFSNGDGKHPRKPFDSVVFINTYIKFVELVKSKYPKVTIALLSSPMVKGASGKMLEQCLASVKMKIDAAYPADKPVSLFFFEPMQAQGCNGHPSVEQHAILAGQLEPFFKKLLEQH